MSIETAEEQTAMERVGALVAGVTVHPELRGPLNEGLVPAIEPMIGLGAPELFLRDDGWTVATADHSLSAHVEHTVVVRRGGGRTLTAA